MFYFRINRVRVSDNREKKSFLGILGKDLAEVKLLSFITTGMEQLPDITSYLDETDEKKKGDILKGMISNTIANRIISTNNIRDNSYIPFGDTGLTLYQANTIPDNFDWSFIILESDRHTRDNAALIQNMISSRNFNSFANDLSALLKTAANPSYMATVSIVKFAITTITDLVKKDKDDLIGQLNMSLVKVQDYPDGKRDSQNVPDLTGNIMIDYSLFGG